MWLPAQRCYTNPRFRLAREADCVVVGVSGQRLRLMRAIRRHLGAIRLHPCLPGQTRMDL